MRIDRKRFFAEYRAAFYPKGGLTQPTVAGLETVLARVERDGLDFYGTIEGLAYCLGTWRHESGHTVKGVGRVEFVPVRERRANPSTQAKLYRSQARYFNTGHQGRGLVQVTWEDNYRKLGDYPGIKGLLVSYKGAERVVTGAWLAANPDAMLDPELSYRAAAYGMRDGLYRPPHKLSRYFRKGKAPDYINARNIVNGGLDRAEVIASYARAFERMLRASMLPDEEPEELLDAVGEAPFSAPVPVSEEALADAGERGTFVDDALREGIDPNIDGGAFPTPGIPERPIDGEEGSKPTGATTMQPQPPPSPPVPTTEVTPSSLKGKVAAVIGFIVSAFTAGIGKLLALPVPILTALIISGGLITAALVIGVIYLKNQREARANAKDIALIEANKGA